MDFFSGYKTYALGLVSVAIGVGQLAGFVPPGFGGADPVTLIMGGLGAVFLRQGITTEAAKDR